MLQHLKHIAFAGATCIVALLFACTSPEKEKRKEKQSADFDVYDEGRFADILYDLTMVEAAYRLNMADAGAVTNRNVVYQKILQRHDTDTLTFNQNWNYYGGEPEDMITVYKMVTERIDKERVARGAQPIQNPEPVVE